MLAHIHGPTEQRGQTMARVSNVMHEESGIENARSCAFSTDIEFMHAAERVPDIPSARERGSRQWDAGNRESQGWIRSLPARVINLVCMHCRRLSYW